METSGLQKREELRDSLQCLNFQWYLDTVYPDAPFPNRHHYLGRVRYLPIIGIKYVKM